VLFAICAKTFGIAEHLLPPDPRLERFFEVATLERGLIVSLLAILGGVALLLLAINQWRLADFGRLDYARTMRAVVPGATMVSWGLQTMFSSFFISILGLRRT
jgi:hypothetical protein